MQTEVSVVATEARAAWVLLSWLQGRLWRALKEESMTVEFWQEFLLQLLSEEQVAGRQSWKQREQVRDDAGLDQGGGHIGSEKCLDSGYFF